MRILLVSPYSGIVGGISIWTKNIMSYMNNSNDVKVELCDFSRKITGQMISNPIKKWALAIRDYLHLTNQAKQIIANFDGEAVHICSSASLLLIRDILLLKSAKRKGLKTFVHFHFGRIPELFQKNNWECKLLKRVVKLADNIIVMDRLSFNVLHSQGYTNISLLPNPLSKETEELAERNQSIRQKGLVLFVGHCIPTKGVFELVEACKDIPNIKLRMVGAVSNDIRVKLMNIAGPKHEWLEIIGQVPHKDIIKQMNICDIFVLPTYTEGFPNVILESMACGCPIIASAVGAIPEMLEEKDNKEYGILIPPKNINSLKDAINKLLSDDMLKNECGNNAKNRVLQRYCINAVCQQLIKIWKSQIQ